MYISVPTWSQKLEKALGLVALPGLRLLTNLGQWKNHSSRYLTAYWGGLPFLPVLENLARRTCHILEAQSRFPWCLDACFEEMLLRAWYYARPSHKGLKGAALWPCSKSCLVCQHHGVYPKTVKWLKWLRLSEESGCMFLYCERNYLLLEGRKLVVCSQKATGHYGSRSI